MFQLTKDEWDSLRFQFGILETGRGKYTKYLPHAFTEQGLAMLSGVLNSDIAIDVNISIMRAFVALRKLPPLVRKDDLLAVKREVIGNPAGRSYYFKASISSSIEQHTASNSLYISSGSCFSGIYAMVSFPFPANQPASV